VWLMEKTCNVDSFELVASADGRAPSVRRVDLREHLYSIWVEQLRQNRRDVAQKFLRSRCEADASVLQAAVMRTCPGTPGGVLPGVTPRLSCRDQVAGPPPGAR